MPLQSSKAKKRKKKKAQSSVNDDYYTNHKLLELESDIAKVSIN